MRSHTEQSAKCIQNLPGQLQNRNVNIVIHALRVLDRNPVHDCLPLLLDLRTHERAEVRRKANAVLNKHGRRWLSLIDKSDDEWRRLIRVNSPLIRGVMLSRYGLRRVSAARDVDPCRTRTVTSEIRFQTRESPRFPRRWSA